MAACGKTSWSRCRLRTAELEECKGCTLVNRISDNWKMIDHKPHKKCKVCGEFLPLWKFYKTTKVLKSGRESEVYSVSCKMCISAERLRKKEEQKKAT